MPEPTAWLSLQPGDRIRAYSRDQDGFFDQLVTFFIAGGGLSVTTSVLHPDLGDPSAFHVMRISGKDHVSNSTFFVPATPILELVANNRWPVYLEVVERPGSFLSQTEQFVFSDFPKSFPILMLQSMYLHYFETYKTTLDASKPVCKFARVIRNAIAHDGRIDIRNPRAEPVEWRGLAYSAADNGKPIWFTDIASVELILLLEDLDQARTGIAVDRVRNFE